MPERPYTGVCRGSEPPGGGGMARGIGRAVERRIENQGIDRYVCLRVLLSVAIVSLSMYISFILYFSCLVASLLSLRSPAVSLGVRVIVVCAST